jgi:hypothetical protein
MPVYFSQAPVITIGGNNPGMGYFDPNGPGVKEAQNLTPNDKPVKLSPWDGAASPKAAGNEVDPSSPFGSALPVSRVGGAAPTQHPRVVMQFPDKPDDILLSGMLSGGRALSKKALIVDVPSGKGHMVLYAMRPFWRWQTQGSYFLGFNAILNWDHLDAGEPPAKAAAD